MGSPFNTQKLRILRDSFVSVTSDAVSFEKTTLKGAKQAIDLSIREWTALQDVLPLMVEWKDLCIQQIRNALKKPDWKFESFRKSISRNIAVGVSVYSPDESAVIADQPYFCNITIRGYYMKADSASMFLRKSPGITFSVQEFDTFAGEVVGEINSKLVNFASSHYHLNKKMRKSCGLCRDYAGTISESGESDQEPPAKRRKLNDTVDYSLQSTSIDNTLNEVSKLLNSLHGSQSTKSITIEIQKQSSTRSPSPTRMPPAMPRHAQADRATFLTLDTDSVNRLHTRHSSPIESPSSTPPPLPLPPLHPWMKKELSPIPDDCEMTQSFETIETTV